MQAGGSGWEQSEYPPQTMLQGDIRSSWKQPVRSVFGDGLGSTNPGEARCGLQETEAVVSFLHSAFLPSAHPRDFLAWSSGPPAGRGTSKCFQNCPKNSTCVCGFPTYKISPGHYEILHFRSGSNHKTAKHTRLRAFYSLSSVHPSEAGRAPFPWAGRPLT